jgi:hypothetical protein
MPGEGLTHGPPATKKAGGSHHRISQIIRYSLRNGLNSVLRALPGDRAFLPPSSRETCFAQLGASVGASGPHDFTVRDLDVRLTRGRVHRIPPPTFVTIAKRSSSRPRDARKSACDLPDGTSALACDMLARRAICAWQVCWTYRPSCAGVADRSTRMSLVDPGCVKTRRRSIAIEQVTRSRSFHMPTSQAHSILKRNQEYHSRPASNF